MTAMKRDDVTVSVEGETEASQGVKRLHLSVTRMKKLRSRVQAGGVIKEEAPNSPGAGSWA